jgi:hypothetical protein
VKIIKISKHFKIIDIFLKEERKEEKMKKMNFFNHFLVIVGRS